MSKARNRTATPQIVLFLLLGAVSIILGCAGMQAAPITRKPAPQWALGISILADAIKIAEVIVILWGARQLWLGRGERQAAERAAAELARKAANYQAWQVVNTAQGKGGSGGRTDALEDLARNGVSLAGVRLDDAWLRGFGSRGPTCRARACATRCCTERSSGAPTCRARTSPGRISLGPISGTAC